MKTINATKARSHFSNLIEQAKRAPIIVERYGKAEIVILSKKEYDQLTAANEKLNLHQRLEELHFRIRAEIAGRTLPDPIGALRQGRNERDEQLEI